MLEVTMVLLGPDIAPHYRSRYIRPAINVKGTSCVHQLYDQKEGKRYLCGARVVNEAPHGLLCDEHRSRLLGSRETFDWRDMEDEVIDAQAIVEWDRRLIDGAPPNYVPLP